MLLLSACDPATQVAGNVRDKNGKEIAEAMVIMESTESGANGSFKKEAEQKTKPDGTYNFVTITGAANKARLTFSKEGYITRQIDIEVNKKTVLDVVMEPDVK